MTADHTAMTADHTAMTADHTAMTADHSVMTMDHSKKKELKKYKLFQCGLDPHRITLVLIQHDIEQDHLLENE